MKKHLFIVLLFVFTAVLCVSSYAAEQTAVPQTQITTTAKPACSLDGKLKIEGYGEYINFTGGDINNSTWGGGVLARYLFWDWLGAQTNVTFYSKCKTKDIGGDLSFTNWRLSLLLHTYSPDVDPKLYGYFGAGLGVQFNNDINDVKIKNALTGHILLGIGYDITDILHAGAEVGYQFGKADADNYTDDRIGLDAIFVRLAAGVRF